MDWNKVRGCRLLLGSLIALWIAFPFLEDVTRPLFLILPLAAVFVAAVWAVHAGRAHVRRALVLASAQLILTALSVLCRENPALYLLAVSSTLAAVVLLILFSIYCVLRYVLRATVITTDQISAGISAYMMMAFAFGSVFYLINILVPGSFLVNTAAQSAKDNPDLMYFSFVTLATLGYGDITPAGRLARSLSTLEALTGTLYMAVFMARLVSMRVSRREASQAAPPE
jgi:hypothetical protein